MMLPPEIIDVLKREREEQDRPALELPLYPPEVIRDDATFEDEEKTESSPIIIIDLV